MFQFVNIFYISGKTHLTVEEPPVPRNLDPAYFTSTLYFEVFQETSAGDFGVELLPDGPLFRCHSSVINSVFPGFLAHIRAEVKTHL